MRRRRRWLRQAEIRIDAFYSTRIDRRPTIVKISKKLGDGVWRAESQRTRKQVYVSLRDLMQAVDPPPPARDWRKLASGDLD